MVELLDELEAVLKVVKLETVKGEYWAVEKELLRANYLESLLVDQMAALSETK